MTLNVLVQVGTVVSKPERFSPGRGSAGQARFTFACESESSFGVPAMREAMLTVFLVGRQADWATHQIEAGARVVLKGRLGQLVGEIVIVADWIEVVRK